MPNEFSKRPSVDNAAAAAPYIGMRGTHTWTEEELPKGYREGVQMLWPQGRATLTGMLSKVKKVRESQSHFMWFEKKKWIKSTSITHSVTSTAPGTIVSVTVPEGFKNMIRDGHEVLLRKDDNHSIDVVAKVVDVVRSATPTVKCLVKSGTDMTGANRLLIIGNVNPEASVRPAAISYNAYERDNYQQIFRTALSMSRTDLKNRSRLGDRYKDKKLEAMQDHAEEQEGVLLFGEKDIVMGENGMPERMTAGFIPMIKQYAPDNYINCKTHAIASGDFFGSTGFGLDLLENGLIEPSFMWTDASEKFVFVGNKVISACQRLVRDNSTYNITHGEKVFGINVSRFETPFGVWNLHRYTPFNLEPSLQSSLLAFELDQLEMRYTEDFHFEKDIHFGKGGGSGLDGLVEGFLSEFGLAYFHLEKAIYAYNFGEDA